MRRSRCFQHAPFKAYNRTNILIRLQNNNNFIKIPNFFKKFVTFPQKSLKNPQKQSPNPISTGDIMAVIQKNGNKSAVRYKFLGITTPKSTNFWE